ncbi:hypothetical protein VitviT2T_004533 [Vitis vinifera]|uniref:60S ribosomal protein L17-2 n=1 Tax=Vitis vinifera TaxID=29760 RepID=A0ABY9BQ98_VITVI|nr:hypothetical protein VitviT2T_004533 [Vitis vinifera]
MRDVDSRESSSQVGSQQMLGLHRESGNPTKCCKAKDSDFRVHFKNTRETAHVIRKLPLAKAKRYLDDVLVHKQAIHFTHFCKGTRGINNTHGRINPYMSSPCHIKLISFENEEPIKKEPEIQLATSKSKKSHAVHDGASS